MTRFSFQYVARIGNKILPSVKVKSHFISKRQWEPVKGMILDAVKAVSGDFEGGSW